MGRLFHYTAWAVILGLSTVVAGAVDQSLAIVRDGAPAEQVSNAVQELVGVLRRGGRDGGALRAKLGELATTRPALKAIRLDTKLHPLTRVLEASRYFSPTTAPATRPAWAGSFPGEVPADAKPARKTITLSGRTPGWQSTGLYAPPGRPVSIAIPAVDAKQAWTARIGCHTDRLWQLDQWARYPEISRTFALTQPSTVVANEFGGLVYLIAPAAGKDAEMAVTIDGAVEAPSFILGQTDAKSWREHIRSLPGPWAELGTRKVILTVPASEIRELDDPESLLRFWDRVLDADADLASRPKERIRPERIVADVQISAGYMHSGYPIMTHLDAAARMVDVKLLLSKGDWGLFHELGHNHQSPEWTFAGTGEVTCNLFTVYVMETVCQNVPRRKGLSPAENLAKLRKHMADGSPFEAWQKDPFLALSMYLQVRDEFGWEVYRKVLAEYRALPDRERPRTDAQKRDQWLIRISKATGRNLGPFFAAWGVPASEEARAAVKHLPGWMPLGLSEPASRPKP